MEGIGLPSALNDADDIIRQVETHPDWTREDILEYMRHSIGLVRRVQKKAFPAEFPTEE